ncbi:uncharacterized protein LOC113360270 [Papaver somniferum]|uniref:uncharacterized protein LOC113360270 n=1 Tax=Papaver somniferum TaxID=3469 RepID=UPI000E6FED01|nr:uncharacterized protein LOC113360270 [Papaver somniferum]
MRELFWNDLKEIRAGSNEAWCFVGDVNSVRCDAERNKPGGDLRNVNFLNNFVSEQEMIDLPLHGGSYTWSNKLEDPLLCRLDRVLVCTLFDSRFSNATQTVLVRTISDHNALILDLTSCIRNNSSFKIETHWMEHPYFVKLVEVWWNTLDYTGAPGFVLFRKLQNLKYFIKNWSKITFGNVKKTEEELTKKIKVLNIVEESAVLSTSQREERAVLLKKLNDVKITRARMAYQRAKVKSFKDGDKNTRYFHTIANGKRRRNCITKLEINGVDVFNQDAIKAEIHQFYTDLFTARTSVTPTFDNLKFRRIDSVQQQWIERVFEEEEVPKVIKLCGANKAPGPDGYNLEFYKVCWNILKGDIMAAVNEFFSKGRLDWRLNTSFLKLIPKEDSYTVG